MPMSKFNIGDAVSFISSKRNRKEIGAVVAVRRVGSKIRGYWRYEVRTQSGINYTVPEQMLQSEKLSTKQADVLVGAGSEFLEKRREHRAERNDKMAERMQHYIKDLHPGQIVKVFSHHMWLKTAVVKVDREAGKVTVLNPKDLLEQEFGRINPDITSKKVITVWANRIKTNIDDNSGGIFG